MDFRDLTHVGTQTEKGSEMDFCQSTLAKTVTRSIFADVFAGSTGFGDPHYVVIIQGGGQRT